MILRRNQPNQTVHIGPLMNDGGFPVTSGANAYVGLSAGDSLPVHVANGVWRYTFSQEETDQALISLRIQSPDEARSVVLNFATLEINAAGLVSSPPSIVVLPGRDRGAARPAKGKIVVSQGERITIARQVVDANGSPVNLAGRTLQVVIETAQGVDLVVIPNSSITISGTNNDTYSFVVPEAASSRVGNFTYALNDIGSSKAELAKGDWIVEYRPLADS